MEQEGKSPRTAARSSDRRLAPRGRQRPGTFHCELRVDFSRSTLKCEIFGHKPSQAEQQDHGDDGLRYGAVNAPDAEAVLLDHRKAEREEKSQTRGKECCETLARHAEAAEKQI